MSYILEQIFQKKEQKVKNIKIQRKRTSKLENYFKSSKIQKSRSYCRDNKGNGGAEIIKERIPNIFFSEPKDNDF